MYETCLCVAGSWRGTGGGSPGQQGVEGVREAGKERVGSGISTRSGSGKGIQKGKHSLFITAYHPVKNTNLATFFTSIKFNVLQGFKQNFICEKM